METLFVHFNNHTNNSPKTRKKGSYTFSGVVVGNMLHIGVARCSTKDQFVKKIGRVKAEGRAKSSLAGLIPIPKEVIRDKKYGNFFIEKCKELLQSKKK